MALIDESLERLRQHAADLNNLVCDLRQGEPMMRALIETLERAARNVDEDVKTLQILAIAVGPEVTPAKQAPTAQRPAAPAAALTGMVPAPCLQPDALLSEAMANHDRDYAAGRNGLPPHHAGELPSSCGACAVFAGMVAVDVEETHERGQP